MALTGGQKAIGAGAAGFAVGVAGNLVASGIQAGGSKAWKHFHKPKTAIQAAGTRIKTGAQHFEHGVTFHNTRSGYGAS